MSATASTHDLRRHLRLTAEGIALDVHLRLPETPIRVHVLKACRDLSGISQADLAAAVGVDKTTISDLERGKNKNPSWETVSKIAAALGVDPHELFPVDVPKAVNS